MADPHESIEDAIEALARRGVKKGAEGDRNFEHMTIQELIEAERHIASKGAAAKKHFGLRMTKIIPPGGG